MNADVALVTGVRWKEELSVLAGRLCSIRKDAGKGIRGGRLDVEIGAARDRRDRRGRRKFVCIARYGGT